MLRRRRGYPPVLGRVSCLAFSLVVLGACQEPPDLSGEIQEYADLINAGRVEACVCYPDLGYESVDSCLEGLGEVDEADQECMADALEGEEEARKEFLKCATAVEGDYVDCLAADPGCEPGWADDCRDARSTALNSCNHLSEQAEDSLDLCLL